jgi:excisionase family DNA binding protein
MIEQFFTTEQVAKLLQVHPFTILKFIKQGKLNGVKIGRMYRIKESDVQTFLQERVTSASSKKQPSKAKTSTKTKTAEKVTTNNSVEAEFQVSDKQVIDSRPQNSKEDPYYII